MVMLELSLFVLGFIVLIKGSDMFVEAASRIAKKFGVSEFLIGVSLVAIGTSIPELASSIAASLEHDTGLIIGGVLGSNVANIGLILGLSAFIGVVHVKKLVIRRDAKIMVFAPLAFYLLSFNGVISAAEGILFLLFYVAYLSYIFSEEQKGVEKDLGGFLDHFMKFKYITTISKATLHKLFSKKPKPIKKKEYLEREGLVKDFMIVLISIVAIVYGSKYMVVQAIYLAGLIGVSTNIIGLTLVAIGTSIPELSVAIKAAKKGYGDMVIGNVIGSNITNIFLIMGVTSLISPLQVSKSILTYVAPALIVISLLCVQMMRTQKKLSTREGIILMILYAFFILSLVFIG